MKLQLVAFAFAFAYAVGSTASSGSFKELAARSESAAQSIRSICQLKASHGHCGKVGYCKRDLSSQQQAENGAIAESSEAADASQTRCSLCISKFPELFCRPRPHHHVDGTEDAME